MKRTLSAKSSYLLLFLGAWVALIFSLWFMLSQANAIVGGQLVVRIFAVAAESALILAPYWIVPRRWRWTVFIPLFLIDIWLIIIIWYFRFWADIPGVSAVMLTSNFNSELFRSILSLYNWSDIFAVLPTILLSVAYCLKLRGGSENYNVKFSHRCVAIFASLALYISFHAVGTVSRMRFLRANNIDAPYSSFFFYLQDRLYPDNWQNVGDMRSRGIIIAIGQQISDAIDIKNIKVTLSDEEVEQIERFIAESELPQVLSDSLAEANSQKNIILVIVESLNSSGISEEVTPTLSMLLGQPGTVSALNITPQIAAGGSGDGQLLANTGLLPLTTFSTAVALGTTNTFPSLVKLSDKHTPTVIFADQSNAWNERNTFRSYGFDPIYCGLDYVDLTQELGLDLAMFTFADSIITTLTEPFFLELLTASMHAPFDDPNIPDSLSAQHITDPDPVMQNYLRVLNYFDYSLGHLINTLKERGLYDNTLLFVVSDHSQNISASGNDNQKMAFIAANTGLTRSVEQQAWQSDVFPTILQLVDASDSAGWKGAGTSLLGEPMTDERREQASDISKLILRGDFFAKKSLK